MDATPISPSATRWIEAEAAPSLGNSGNAASRQGLRLRSRPAASVRAIESSWALKGWLVESSDASPNGWDRPRVSEPTGQAAVVSEKVNYGSLMRAAERIGLNDRLVVTLRAERMSSPVIRPTLQVMPDQDSPVQRRPLSVATVARDDRCDVEDPGP